MSTLSLHLLAFLWSWAPTAAGAPGLWAAPPPSPQRVDSIAAVRDAREAQARFERDRLRFVPVARGGDAGRCDERLGRLCLQLDEDDDWWPEPRRAALVEARETLLDALAAAASQAPGDAWILGQRVAYLGEAGRWAEALRIARQCRSASQTWCQALSGLALHAQGAYEAAAGAFTRALKAMPPEERESWLDPGPLLDREGRRLWDDAREPSRDDVSARFWRLSDPLQLVDGNDRLTEHLARHAMVRIRQDARNPYDLPWGRDLEELLLRYGWTVGWERSAPSVSLSPRGAAVSHHHPYSLAYVPGGRAWSDPAAAEPADWNPGSRMRPRTGYAPAYAPVFLPADAQVAVLPRGQRIAVVAAVSLPEDTTWHRAHGHPPLPATSRFSSRPDQKGLFLISLDHDTVYGTRSPADRPGGMILEAPAGAYVLSAEVWSPALGRAGRVRRGVRPSAHPDGIATLSDLMLARATGASPSTTEDLLPNLLVRPRVVAGDSVQVAWETHGLGWVDEMISYRLRLRREGDGLATRVGRWLKLLGDAPTVELAWREPAPPDPGLQARSVVLSIPADLPAGEYNLMLELTSRGRSGLWAARSLRVAPTRR